MKYIFVLIVGLFSMQSQAINSEGYTKISVIKAWDSTLDIYFEDGQEHLCEGSLKTRFLVDSSKPHHVSFSLAAFMAGKPVSLSYSCNENGHPWVAGIRVAK